MPLLPGLAVVFVGITGGGEHSRVEQQVQLILQEHDVKATPMSSAVVKSLARHDKASAELVRQMHVDGVVGGELVMGRHGRAMLRVVVYDADGSLKSLSETALSGPTLTRDSIAVLTSNLDDEVSALETSAQKQRDKRAVKTPPQTTVANRRTKS
jgi:hypothetical protein